MHEGAARAILRKKEGMSKKRWERAALIERRCTTHSQNSFPRLQGDERKVQPDVDIPEDK